MEGSPRLSRFDANLEFDSGMAGFEPASSLEHSPLRSQPYGTVSLRG